MMRFQSVHVSVLLAAFLVFSTFLPAEAQPPRPGETQPGGPGRRGGPPLVKNAKKAGKTYVWQSIATYRPPSPDLYEAIVVHIKPQEQGQPQEKMTAWIWLYDAVDEGSNKAKLHLVEKYKVELAPLRRSRKNALSNLVVTVDQKCGATDTGKKRMFVISGSQSPGGKYKRGPMLRVTTMIVESGAVVKPCETPTTTTSEDAKPKELRTGLNGCEDYPDDEMLEETEYDGEYDFEEDDPIEEGEEYVYVEEEGPLEEEQPEAEQGGN
jgi:hypothetical protein